MPKGHHFPSCYDFAVTCCWAKYIKDLDRQGQHVPLRLFHLFLALGFETSRVLEAFNIVDVESMLADGNPPIATGLLTSNLCGAVTHFKLEQVHLPPKAPVSVRRTRSFSTST